MTKNYLITSLIINLSNEKQIKLNIIIILKTKIIILNQITQKI